MSLISRFARKPKLPVGGSVVGDEGEVAAQQAAATALIEAGDPLGAVDVLAPVSERPSNVRTMNVWIALSDCGGDHPASGLELLPRRVDEILPTVADFVRSAVSFDLVDEMAVETPVINPAFGAGDALMFDERFLHRTSLGPGLTTPRYALECWFFAPSHTNETYISFAV